MVAKRKAGASECSKVKVLRVPRKIKFGSDFSGVDGWLMALKSLTEIMHVFSCDSCPHVKTYTMYAHRPKEFYENILDRNDATAPYVDIYTWSPPCQDFSTAGKQLGLKGKRKVGQLLRKSLLFIKTKQPRLTIFENTPTMVSAKFKPVAKGIIKSLKKLGYVVHSKIMDSRDYGAPAMRSRFFVVAIRADSLRRPFTFPPPVGRDMQQSVIDILDDFDRKKDKAGRLPATRAARDRCYAAYRKVVDDHCRNPLKTPIMVDIDCSPKYAAFGINVAKTLTRTRGMQGGPWVSTRGRRVTTDELLRLQGFEPGRVHWKGAGITKAQIGGMVGNAVTVHTVGYLLAEAMFAAGLTTKKLQFQCPNQRGPPSDSDEAGSIDLDADSE